MFPSWHMGTRYCCEVLGKWSKSKCFIVYVCVCVCVYSVVANIQSFDCEFLCLEPSLWSHSSPITGSWMKGVIHYIPWRLVRMVLSSIVIGSTILKMVNMIHLRNWLR